MYLDQPLKNFLDDLAAREPTPGGGSSSALAGAIGAALGSMSAIFTTGNEKFANVEPKAQELLAKLEAMRSLMSALIEQDIEAYRDLVAARRLPKETEEQKAARKAAIAMAQEKTTAVPEAIVDAALEAQTQVLELAPICNPNLMGDVAVAAYLLEAAARGAAIQIQCNLCGPKAGPDAPSRRRKARENVEACERMRTEIERKVLETLGLQDDT
jgi:formiminotetrahydrofolate cyclodeaminase